MEPLLADLFEKNGESVKAAGNAPFLLIGREHFWYVKTGSVEIFTVNLVKEKPVGVRSHFLSRKPGDCMFGMELGDRGIGFGFLAVGSVETELYRLDISFVRELVSQPEYAGQFSNILDNWIREVSWNLTKDMPHPKADLNLSESGTISLERLKKIRSNKGVLWIKAEAGRALFISREEFSFKDEADFFPLTPDTWLEISDERRKIVESVLQKTPYMIEEASFDQVWHDLGCFHTLVCRCKSAEDRIRGIREDERLHAKADYAKTAKHHALANIASVLNTVIESPSSDTGKGNEDPVFLACQHIGNMMGMQVKLHPDIEKSRNRSVQDKLNAIAKASRFRVRSVLLKEDWYHRDQGPMLGFFEDTGDPVAMLPISPKVYEFINPQTGQTERIDAKNASVFKPGAFCFYAPLPDGLLKIWGLLKFGIHHLEKDIAMVLMMGVTIGGLGVMTPYFTGQIFDMVIPQAARGLLYQFTIALIVSAFANSAFEICRGIATLRIQGSMDYRLQASVWDRLLSLPTSFFRKYSVGDLADRVAGISKIRDLLAETGVSAMLGALTSVFYVATMFFYSVPLGFTAIGVTMIVVGFTFGINMFRLRQQRLQLETNGKIAGIGLQLISGISKIRVTGAESFAFRRWAVDFSQHRRVSIAVGNIQNMIAVLMSGFPVFSSMVIYGMLVYLQGRPQQETAPLTTGDFLAFTSAYGMFQSAMLAISESSVDFFRVVPIYERLKPILTTIPEIDEIKKHPGELTGEIEASHLRFRYDPDGDYIIKDVSFRIRPGEFVAFVGGSGSGKSTLMRMLMGFEKPESGTICYDGQDLANLDLREVRQQAGVVLQDSQVLPTTIFQNIIGTSSLTQDDAWEAARMSGLAEDIRQMPMGMHTVVSEGGGTFSGGQRQRLMIARAVVNKPRILYLDEATSALDNRTQSQVTESMDKLQATRIVIAHRLSTIVNADRIFVLERGEIRESGTYEELMKLDGVFAQLAKRQIV